MLCEDEYHCRTLSLTSRSGTVCVTTSPGLSNVSRSYLSTSFEHTSVYPCLYFSGKREYSSGFCKFNFCIIDELFYM